MGTGPRSIEEWRDTVVAAAGERAALAEAAGPPVSEDRAGPAATPRRLLDKAPALIFLLGGLAWVAAVAWGVAGAVPLASLGFLRAISWIALASGPLGLLAILYLLLLRTSRREARRFGRTAAAMQAESARLETLLASLSERIGEHRAALDDQGGRLLAISHESADRLTAAGERMRGDIAEIGRQAALLDDAATSARTDIGVLLSDLPDAESRARALGASLAASGVEAGKQIGAMETGLSAVSERAREATQEAGGGTERMLSLLGRIDENIGNVSQRLDEAAEAMARTVDGALDSASRAIEQTRAGLTSQSAAMLAMIEQASTFLDRAGADSAQALSHRIDEISGRIDAFAGRLAAQDTASRTLVDTLDTALTGVERRFDALGDTGAERTADLAEAIVTLTGHVDAIGATIGRSGVAAGALLGQTGDLRVQIDDYVRTIDEALPAALARAEAQAGHSLASIGAALPQAKALATAASAAAADLGQADALIARQQQAFGALSREIGDRLGTLEGQTREIQRALTETGAGARSLAESASGQLVDALLRVREAAQQSADHAREALGRVIPEAAERIGAGAGAAIDRVLGERVAQQLATIDDTAAKALQATQRATERLMRQMLTITETTSAIEDRIAEAKDTAARSDQDAFSRRIALLIESLNSTAIDVTKLLSNDVTDAAWAAYLRGDRGVFTRRAVRLLDAAEVREVLRHYESEPDFREQVNRYIHDFEAMLRRILATRDGGPLGVTMLSSDMGKLYVALAQAIERLRR